MKAVARAGEIIVRTFHHRDVEHARSPHRAAMSGHDGPAPAAQLAELRLDMRSGRARWDLLCVTGIEFPLFDARTPGDRSARLYMPTNAGDASAPYFNAVLDHARDRSGIAVLDAQHIASGPLATAWLPYAFPLGFHGHLAQAV